MPTRLNSPQISTSSSSIKRQQLRAVVLGAATGFVVAMSSSAVAEGELQLRAPLNSTLTISKAENTWTKRSPSAEGTTGVSAGSTVPPRTESVTAQTTSSPLDRLGNPLAKLPSMKLTPQAKPSQSERPAIQLPGEKVLDQMKPPALPGDSGWVGRSAGNRTSTTIPQLPRTASNAPVQQEEVDGFRPPVVEGNWVARDAINRIEPLRDPSALRDPGQISQPDPQTRVATKVSNSADSSATIESGQQSQPVPNAKTATVKPSRTIPDYVAPEQAVREQAVREHNAQEPAKSSVSSDNFAPRSKSMSLDEAKAIQQVSPHANKPTEADTPRKTPSGSEKELSTARSDSALSSTDLSPKEQTPPAKQIEKELPKRKPLQNLADVDTSSAKRKTIDTSDEGAEKVSIESEKPKRPESAKSSVGDLQPENDSASVLLDYTGHPVKPIRPSRSVANMRTGIERTLRYFYDRPEVANGRSNWGMMHSMMVYGVDTKVIVGRQRYSAIAWIAGNNNCRGQRLLTNDADGIQAKSGVGLQGHQGQFLAVLGMCNVPTSYPLHAGKVKYSVADLIESEKRACKKGVELTFTLIALSHYLDTDTTWTADDGTEWSFERLIAEELKQPIVGAACGGTHRLMGYTHALRKRRAEGKPITGHWKRAETYTQDFIRYAYSIQNRDGSMSTKWFEGRADNGDVDRKIQTTGHIVEWLLTVTPDDQLQDRRLVAAVNYLYRAVGSDLRHDWSIGPKGHALRSLAMYHQRVFKTGTPWIPESIARSQESNTRR